MTFKLLVVSLLSASGAFAAISPETLAEACCQIKVCCEWMGCC